MRDKRPVDELSIEELERILAIRKREERQKNLGRLERAGRVVAEKPATVALTPNLSPGGRGENVLPSPVPEGNASKPANGNGSAAPAFEDDGEADYRPTGKGADERFWRSFVNQSLLLVEVAAVIGLVFLGYQMFTNISALQKETASAQAMADEQRRAGIPTLAPTPQLQINQIVLPGGHTPPTAPGGAQFNYAEVPSNLWSLVETQVMQPIAFRPPPTEETALELNIPKLNVDQTIVQGTDWEALKQGIGQVQNGANPGDERGNLALAAHNDIYGEFFRYLDKLEAGDEFYVRTKTKIYTYRVTGWEVVKPTDVHVLNSTGNPTATLISCYPYGQNTKRIVVYAERVGESF
ncbi:MAG: sortase [Chloroflexi bacterium]|nr:sortase [Chloroflexota bacterium]